MEFEWEEGRSEVTPDVAKDEMGALAGAVVSERGGEGRHRVKSRSLGEGPVTVGGGGLVDGGSGVRFNHVVKVRTFRADGCFVVRYVDGVLMRLVTCEKYGVTDLNCCFGLVSGAVASAPAAAGAPARPLQRHCGPFARPPWAGVRPQGEGQPAPGAGALRAPA